MCDFWWRHVVPAKLALEADPSSVAAVEASYTPGWVVCVLVCVRMCVWCIRAGVVEAAMRLGRVLSPGWLAGWLAGCPRACAPTRVLCRAVPCCAVPWVHCVARPHPYRDEIIRRSKAMVDAAPQRTFTREQTRLAAGLPPQEPPGGEAPSSSSSGSSGGSSAGSQAVEAPAGERGVGAAAGSGRGAASVRGSVSGERGAVRCQARWAQVAASQWSLASR
jgi:hypothetical protein